MRPVHWSTRVAIVTALMLGLMVTSLVAAPSNRADAAANTATITLHVLTCPGNTTKIFANCHDDRLAGVGFTVAGVSRFSDANGVVSWSPGAGTHTIHMFSTDFAEFGKAWVYCKDQTSGDVFVDGRTTTGNVSITTVAGHLTICDWYNLTPAPTVAPRPAVITLHVIECPATTTDVFGTCHDLNRLAGIGFTVAGVSRFSDTSGIVSWGPSAGTRKIHMFSTDFANYGVAYVYCRDQTDGDVLFNGRTFTGDVFITTTAGHLTICDWYNLTAPAAVDP
jgi:hypothetical protein